MMEANTAWRPEIPGNSEEPVALRPLRETIEAIIGPATFFDMSYPFANLLGDQLFEATQVLRLPRTTKERDFLLRFRQAGGHAPIEAIDMSAEDFAWPPPQVAAPDGAEADMQVVGFETIEVAAAVAERLHDGWTALIIPSPPERILSQARTHAGLKRYESVRLTGQNSAKSYGLFLPFDGRRSGAVAASLATARLSFDPSQQNTVLEARSMIHDGGYTSEGDGRYSWLWTGPSTHFRMIVPRVSGTRPRSVEICIPRTEDHFNLDRVEVQLDGCPLAHQLDRWSETSGKISVEMPPGADYAVLTLIVPKLTADANSGRPLGLCLDKLILLP